MIETFLVWLCLQGQCIQVRPEAVAIAACESGDTVTLGTGRWDAYNVNDDGSTDSGAWQFNDYWVWNTENWWVIRPVAGFVGLTPLEFLQRYPSPLAAPPAIQYLVFEYLWDDGRGAWHWNASRDCWSKWVTP